MDFLRKNALFSFSYGEKSFTEYTCRREQREEGNVITTVYTLEDGLCVTNVATKHEKYGAWEWVNYFENTGHENSRILSEIRDCDAALPCAHAEKRAPTPWFADSEKDMFVLNPNGSTTVDEWDFYAHMNDGSVQPWPFLFPHGRVQDYKSQGGRSSNGNAPYFNIHQAGRGYIVAIGWTGQWNCRIWREEDAVHVESGIENARFYLKPGEKIRTSSVVVMPYEGSVEDSQNIWRRFVRDTYNPLPEGMKNLPLCQSIWGGTESGQIIERIELARKLDIPYEYVWMDAGWCGKGTQPTRNEYSGDWASRVGDWDISPMVHPGGLRDVAAKIKEQGKGYVLWFEPERANCNSEFAKAHPDWVVSRPGREDHSLLVMIGREDVWNYIFEKLSAIIGDLGVNCYRQDFNMEPLLYWRGQDEKDREGITEIKHIMGLYRLWDALRARFPGLWIDNCASGGKRLDIEMMRRSVPLWRSDAQCPADPCPETTQANHMNFSLWMPYSGTGSGRVYDTYRMRSSYAAGLSTTYSYSADENFGEDGEKVDWLRARCEEFLRVRPYFHGDIYHLTKPVRNDTAWCATQWDRPEMGDGLVQVFKGENSPYTVASLRLRKIDPKKTYRFEDIDGGSFTVSGEELARDGLSLSVTESRVAKIYFYRAE